VTTTITRVGPVAPTASASVAENRATTVSTAAALASAVPGWSWTGVR